MSVDLTRFEDILNNDPLNNKRKIGVVEKRTLYQDKGGDNLNMNKLGNTQFDFRKSLLMICSPNKYKNLTNSLKVEIKNPKIKNKIGLNNFLIRNFNTGSKDVSKNNQITQ